MHVSVNIHLVCMGAHRSQKRALVVSSCPVWALGFLSNAHSLPISPHDLDDRLTAEEMDEQRRQNVAYQYLCRLEEAKR